ncbi:hypothetical protein PSHT_06385 [Puccinia striiformis]|uniref:Uncharacterized protein n=2 Tax=Puccinia striiformis TaxID=27350 RepID=A0A2S4W6R9_9BASI|nr:hypothetical protein PSHT_06385 [Puccinia striiformis]
MRIFHPRFMLVSLLPSSGFRAMVIEHSALAGVEGQSCGKRISLQAIPYEKVVDIPLPAGEEDLIPKLDPATSPSENNHNGPVKDQPGQKISDPRRLKLKENWESNKTELKMLHEDSEELKKLFKDIQGDIRNLETISKVKENNMEQFLEMVNFLRDSESYINQLTRFKFLRSGGAECVDIPSRNNIGKLMETGEKIDPELKDNIQRLPSQIHPSIVEKLGPWILNTEEIIEKIKDSILAQDQLKSFYIQDYDEEHERINLYLAKMIDFLFKNKFIDHESNDHLIAFKDEKIMNMLEASNLAYIDRKVEEMNLDVENINEEELVSLSFEFLKFLKLKENQKN